MSKRFIDPELWSNPDFGALSVISKSGVIYCMTSSVSHVSGLVRIKRKTLIHEVFCGEPKHYNYMIQELMASPLVVVDTSMSENPLLFMPFFIDGNAYLNSPKNIDSILGRAGECIQSVTATLLYYKVKKEKPNARELAHFEKKYEDAMKEGRWTSTFNNIESSGGLSTYIERYHSKQDEEEEGEDDEE